MADDTTVERCAKAAYEAAMVVEVAPPLADGQWWLVQCHGCREIIGDACSSAWDAEARRADHAAAHERAGVVSARLRNRLGRILTRPSAGLSFERTNTHG